MAGKGFPPKPADQRARGNKDVIPMRVIEVEPTQQPDLPDSVDWHPQTLIWWHKWCQSKLSENFTDDDWTYLMDTALIHNAVWQGETKLAGELRLRCAKFGQTPEDRARLRIQFATADEVEQKGKDRENNPQSSRSRYKPPQAG